ncbi:MAG: 4'-phosphopantetheinyl transferase superfamily protein [Gammaproteobacteria bacterium]
MSTSNVSYVDALESEVHVWLARPDAVTDAAYLADCIAMLGDDERERYRRFRFEKDRHLFLVAHALVRRVLSCYVDVGPADWHFVSGAHGRPEVAAPPLPVNLRFNLSHTSGLAACVVTLNDACGIDAERLDRRPRMRAIAAKLFAGPEVQDLLDREGSAVYHERFFTYWTLREAWCKALGTGLAHEDRSVWFDLDGCDAVRLHGAAGQWQFAVQKPTTEHVLAIAVLGTDGIDKAVVSRFLEP